ncbi:hypothetical protein [Lignipirellula cremea]|uniref:Uncharacterized protein n=1 Tax=Lignipirellula cremea TaxID=2528010 RepID=A0A518DQI2_9BACT|nr:hypothetical protein [Lignipirellula cremea]QDU94091.1 hypothetical protein Pla8534_18770 [Lignipirellula cremea]
MPFRIDEKHSANSQVLEVLRSQAVEKTPKNRSSWDIDSFELHTHPDLIERLELLSDSLPQGYRRVAHCDCPTLVAENGIVFAFASGMSQVTLRLPHGTMLPTTKIAFELDPPWYSFNPWGKNTVQLSQELRRAFEEAGKITSDE